MVQHPPKLVTTTYTTDWFLWEEEYRRKLGEWLKTTSVRSQDQRRILQTTTHRFPSNVWIHKIMKGKESNKCDLCKDLLITETRFTTETVLLEQDLVHIHHTCETLSETHTSDHHTCWGREKITNHLERIVDRIRRTAMSEYHG